MKEKIKVGVILGSIRTNRLSEQIGHWIVNNGLHSTIEYAILDLKDYDLPLYGSVVAEERIQPWNKAIDSCDAFIIIAGEYNYSISSALKNGLDYAFKKWANKPVLIVAYGYAANGGRAESHLKDILGSLKAIVLDPPLLFSLIEDATDEDFLPRLFHLETLKLSVNNLADWAMFLQQAPVSSDSNLYYYQINQNRSVFLSSQYRPECAVKGAARLNVYDSFISTEEQDFLLATETPEVILRSVFYRIEQVCKNIYNKTLYLSDYKKIQIKPNELNDRHFWKNTPYIAIITLSTLSWDYQGSSLNMEGIWHQPFKMTPFRRTVFHFDTQLFDVIDWPVVDSGECEFIVCYLSE